MSEGFRLEFSFHKEGGERKFLYFHSMIEAEKVRNAMADRMNSLDYMQVQELDEHGWRPVSQQTILAMLRALTGKC